MVFQNAVTCLGTLNISTLTESTIYYSNPEYLGPAYFEQTGMSYSNLLRIN